MDPASGMGLLMQPAAPERTELYEIARAFLSVRKLEQPEFERLLIRAKAEAIPPLLRALHSMIGMQRLRARRLARQARRSKRGMELFRAWWAQICVEPLLDAANDVIQRIGPEAQLALVKSIVQPSASIQIEAALLLEKSGEISMEAEQAIEPLLAVLAIDRKKRFKTLIVLLGIVLTRSGDVRWRTEIEEWAAKRGSTLSEYADRMRKMAILELLAAD